MEDNKTKGHLFSVIFFSLVTIYIIFDFNNLIERYPKIYLILLLIFNVVSLIRSIKRCLSNE